MEIFENGNGYVGFGEGKRKRRKKKRGDEKNERNGVGRGLDYANLARSYSWNEAS